MFESWFSWWSSATQIGAVMRNPRGSLMRPKHVVVKMLRAAFEAGEQQARLELAEASNAG